MKRKKLAITLLLGALCSTVLLAGCNTQMMSSTESNNAQASSSQTESQEESAATVASENSNSSTVDSLDNSTTTSATPTVTMQLQEYSGDNIGEVPVLSGVKNDAIDKINSELADLVAEYQETKAENSANSPVAWVECRAYPSVNKKYVNLAFTWAEYPTYGTQGKVISYVYDIDNQKEIDPEDALTLTNTTKAQIQSACATLLEQENPYQTISDLDVEGCKMNEDGSADIYVVVSVTFPSDTPLEYAATDYNAIYIYHTATQTISAYKVNQPLIPAKELASFTPALAYESMSA